MISDDTNNNNNQSPQKTSPTPEDVDSAIRWLRANEQRILQALPLKTPGVTYLEGWLETVLSRAQQWEKKKTPFNLAVCYILLPLRAVNTALQEK
ncbi:MAG: hypothetical protein AAFQ63_15735 [Cyanobacteria bacterium J06621_11]